MSIPLAAMPYATDPRKNLTRGQIALLRHAEMFLMRRTKKGDWAGGGRYTRGKTIKPLITRQLLEQDFRKGGVSLRITMAGRIALDTLNEKTKKRGG